MNQYCSQTQAALPGIFGLAKPLVLASASLRRQAFLRDMGIACEVVAPPGHAEPFPEPGEKPGAYAARAAKAKAEAVFATATGKGRKIAVLGADTVVASGETILGKPRNEEEAFTFVAGLAGREHRVHTACCLCLEDGRQDAFAASATVRMGRWPENILRAYAASGEGLDKAGGYAVQGLGAFLVESVCGSWSAVIGLPMAETVAALLRNGIIAPVA